MRDQRQKLKTFPQPLPSSRGQLHSMPDSSALSPASPRGTGWVGSGACGQPITVSLVPSSLCFSPAPAGLQSFINCSFMSSPKAAVHQDKPNPLWALYRPHFLKHTPTHYGMGSFMSQTAVPASLWPLPWPATECLLWSLEHLLSLLFH